MEGRGGEAWRRWGQGQPEAQVPPPSSRAWLAPPLPLSACSEAASRAAPQPGCLRRVSAISEDSFQLPREAAAAQLLTFIQNGLLDFYTEN